MIHETVHAYINAMYSQTIKFNSFSFQEKLNKYAENNGYTIGTNEFHHEFMSQYVDAMAISLLQWDTDYGTVISDGEVYTLRYDGTWEDLDRSFNVSNKSYARYMNKFSNYLDGFLNLLQSNNSSNFRIFNLDSNTNTVEELNLDSSSNTTRSNPCN